MTEVKMFPPQQWQFGFPLWEQLGQDERKHASLVSMIPNKVKGDYRSWGSTAHEDLTFSNSYLAIDASRLSSSNFRVALQTIHGTLISFFTAGFHSNLYGHHDWLRYCTEGPPSPPCAVAARFPKNLIRLQQKSFNWRKPPQSQL